MAHVIAPVAVLRLISQRLEGHDEMAMDSQFLEDFPLGLFVSPLLLATLLFILANPPISLLELLVELSNAQGQI